MLRRTEPEAAVPSHHDNKALVMRPHSLATPGDFSIVCRVVGPLFDDMGSPAHPMIFHGDEDYTGEADSARLEDTVNLPESESITEEDENPDPPYMPVLDHDRTIERVRKFAAIAPQEMHAALAAFVEAVEENKAKVHSRADEVSHFEELDLAFDKVMLSVPPGFAQKDSVTFDTLVSTMLETGEVLELDEDIDRKEWVYRRDPPPSSQGRG